jgi:hypothetical protein
MGYDILANQTGRTLWVAHSDRETRDHQYAATVAALIGIEPKDEIDGMIAAQLLSAHNAALGDLDGRTSAARLVRELIAALALGQRIGAVEIGLERVVLVSFEFPFKPP